MALAQAEGDFAQMLLGEREQVVGLSVAVPAELGDLAPGLYEPSHDRGFSDQARVVGGVRGRRGAGEDLLQACPAADLLERVVLVELGDQGDQVDGLPLVVEVEGCSVDDLVGLLVEVLGRDLVADGGDGVAGHEDRPDDRLLGLDGLRRRLSVARHLRSRSARPPRC